MTRIKERLAKEIIAPAFIFLLVIAVTTSTYFAFNASVHTLIEEQEPALELMERLLLDLYKDNIVLLQCLHAENERSKAVTSDELTSIEHKCFVDQEVTEEKYSSELITHEEIAKDYSLALSKTRQLALIRDQIITLREVELTTGSDLHVEKSRLLAKHQEVLQETSAFIETKTHTLYKEKQALRQRLAWQTGIYFGILVLLLLALLLTILMKVRKIEKALVEPIDDTIRRTRKFVDGNYEVKIRKAKLPELAELQEHINTVFSIVQEARKTPLEQKDIDTKLLRKEYVVILQQLTHNKTRQMKTSISDLKKSLHLTHPTIQARLRHLDAKGYIHMRKEGRDKFVYLTAKGEDAV